MILGSVDLDAVVVFDGELLGLAALEVAGEFSTAIEGLVVAVVGFFGLGVGEVDAVFRGRVTWRCRRFRGRVGRRRR